MTQVNLKAGLTVNLKKVSELPATTSLSGTDVLPVSSETGTLKKITATNLLSPLAGGQGNATVGTTPIPGVKWYNLMGGEGIYVNFPESISANISLSSEDVEGGKQWAAIKYEGDTYWTKVQTAEESQSGTATIPYTTAIPFDVGITVIEGVTMTGNITFTPVSSGAIAGCGAMIRLVADGTSTVSFPGFSKLGTGEFISDDGVINQLIFMYNGVEKTVAITQIEEIIIPPVDLTFQAEHVGVSVITGGVQGGGAGSFGNYGRDAKVLPADTDGWMQLKYNGLENRSVFIGFSAESTIGTYTTMEAGLFITDSSGIYSNESGTLTAVDATYDANYYRIAREGNAFKIYKSADGITTSGPAIATLTYTSTAQMYLFCAINGSQTISEPKAKGVL